MTKAKKKYRKFTQKSIQELATEVFNSHDVSVIATGIRDQVENRFTAILNFEFHSYNFRFRRAFAEIENTFIVNRESADEAWREMAIRIEKYVFDRNEATERVHLLIEKITDELNTHPQVCNKLSRFIIEQMIEQIDNINQKLLL